jgi:HEAT repeat protein
VTAKRQSPVEKALQELGSLATVALTDAVVAAVRKALASRYSLVSARAARIVKDRQLAGFNHDLVSIFTRYMQDPVKTDPGCNAKLAALEALDSAEYHDLDVFVTASQHVQKEAAWGPPVDTAGPLRARAVRALAHLGYADLFLVAGERLADPEPPVRQAAADALAHAGERSGAGLILAVLDRTEEDPVVRLAQLSCLMRLAPDWGLMRLEKKLSGPDEEAAELAAMALGESGREDAADLLLESMDGLPLAPRRAVILKALGLHRTERALSALLAVVAQGRAADAIAAVAALAVRRFDAGVPDRVQAAMLKNADVDLTRAYRENFNDQGC